MTPQQQAICRRIDELEIAFLAGERDLSGFGHTEESAFDILMFKRHGVIVTKDRAEIMAGALAFDCPTL